MGKFNNHFKQAGEPEGYTGFLRITCEKCGAIKSFNPKTPVTEFRCEQCGYVTTLENLNSAKFICECGKSWGYKTNARERIIEQPCIACGNLMTAEQDKHGDYKPI